MKQLALWVGTFAGLFSGCGGGGSDFIGHPPDMTGGRVGIFTSTDGVYTQTMSIVITDKGTGSFSGTWESDTLTSTGRVGGFVYPGSDRRWIADLELTQGDLIACCVPLLGCFEWPSRQLSMFGYYENVNGQKSIVDGSASYHYGCLATEGAMNLTQ